MKPSDLSISLRQIAAKIDAARSPDRSLVIRDLSKVISRLSSDLVDSVMDPKPGKGPQPGSPGHAALEVIMGGDEPTDKDSKWMEEYKKALRELRAVSAGF